MSQNNKVGIFGGTFDPLHLGHINSMLSVTKELDLREILVIPTYQSPNRTLTEGPTPEQRLEMVRKGLTHYSDLMKVDDREYVRGGVSYTIDTLHSLVNERPDDQLYLIIGMDQFEQFDRWKEFNKILEQVNLVVTSRPGTDLPTSIEEFPEGVRSIVGDFDGSEGLLKSGKTIHFVQLEDVDVSATEIRKRFRNGHKVSHLVPPPVAEYIREQGLYEAVDEKIGDFEKFTLFCSDILDQKGGINVVGFDLRERQYPSEFTLITSGTSTRHTAALSENVVRAVKDEYGVYPQSVEGQQEGRWIVLDYGALIIHLFYDYVRQEYRLEELWKGGVAMDLKLKHSRPNPAARPQ